MEGKIEYFLKAWKICNLKLFVAHQSKRSLVFYITDAIQRFKKI